jgi:hypothetical protein
VYVDLDGSHAFAGHADLRVTRLGELERVLAMS